MKQILIKTEAGPFIGQLNDSQTTQQIWDALPLEAPTQLWGEELYFRIPVTIPIEDKVATDVVSLGDLAYWPEGQCFCIFPGTTPVSTDNEIKPASTVNVIGRLEGDFLPIKQVSNGSTIILERGQ